MNLNECFLLLQLSMVWLTFPVTLVLSALLSSLLSPRLCLQSETLWVMPHRHTYPGTIYPNLLTRSINEIGKRSRNKVFTPVWHHSDKVAPLITEKYFFSLCRPDLTPVNSSGTSSLVWVSFHQMFSIQISKCKLFCVNTLSS